MAKIKQEINPKCAERLKEMCKMLNTTQTAISEKTYISQNTLSKIAQGKAPMTYNVACAITQQYPSIRLEWLMGVDDFKSEHEKGINEFIQWGEENTSRRNAVKTLALLSGYEIVDLWDYTGSAGRTIEELFNFQQQGMQIKKDGELLGNIPIDKFNLLALDIQELAELRIRSYLREVEESG